MLCLNYKTKIEFFCWIRSRIEKNKWVQKKKLPHSSGDSFFIWTLSLTLLSLYELLHVCYRFRELCAGGTFRFFSGSFFYTYTNLFPSYCFSDDGTAEQPQECLTTFPVIISFAFLLRLIIYFRFFSVWLNRLRNKLLANYLRNRGNDLATVRISVFCVAMLSNNSFICKYNIFFRKYEVSVAIL